MYKRYEHVFLAFFALLAVAVGFWGYYVAGYDYSADPASSLHVLHPIKSFTWLAALRCVISAIGLLRLYDLFQPGIDPWQLVVAQVAVPGVALLSAVQLFFDGIRKNIRTALARHKTNHTIVCGLGDVGMQVIQNLCASGRKVAAINLSEDSPAMATCEQIGVPVLQGDAKNRQVLLAAGIQQAHTVIICTGSDSENVDIALQVEALRGLPSLFRQKRSTVHVLAELRNEWLHTHLTASRNASLSSDNSDLKFFNPFTSAARMLIRRLHLPPNQEFEAHTFILVGFGAYGREIALHMIRAFPVPLGGTLKLLVFDEEADEAQKRFATAFHTAEEIASIEFVKASVTPDSPDMQHIVEPKLRECGPLLGVALALGSDETSLCAGLDIRSLLDRIGALHVPVYVHMEHYRNLGGMVHEMAEIAHFRDRVRVFGTLEETLNPEVLLEQKLDTFARALHEDYRRRSQSDINSEANFPWHQLPEFMKMSNRWRADHTPLLMELAGFRVTQDAKTPSLIALADNQVELLAELEHRRYLIERSLIDSGSGTRHIKEWHELSDSAKEWNRREVRRLPEIMAEAGMQLEYIRNIRLYGEWPDTSRDTLEKLPVNADHEHYWIIVDIDDAEAVRAAAQLLHLRSRSVWLISEETPREFFKQKAIDSSIERTALLNDANGWFPKRAIPVLKIEI